MSNWRDPVEGRDFDLPPRPKDKPLQNKQNPTKASSKNASLPSILSGITITMLCFVGALSIYIATQVNQIATSIENSESKTATPILSATLTPIPPTPIILPTIPISPTTTDIATLESTPTQSSNIVGQENFPDSTIRKISLKDGELIVGTAVKFAVRAYGCNTMDLTQNIPYTVFLIRGPIDLEVEIYNGGWDYWTNIFDGNFAKSLLEPKRDEVKTHPDYLAVGHVECVIPPFK